MYASLLAVLTWADLNTVIDTAEHLRFFVGQPGWDRLLLQQDTDWQHTESYIERL